MVSKEMDKITACEALRLPSASINPDTLDTFSFVDIDQVCTSEDLPFLHVTYSGSRRRYKDLRYI